MTTVTAIERSSELNGQPRFVRDPSSSPVLEVDHLHRYFGRLKAVQDVSFAAYPGQVMGFIGPNGAGKTTAMRILATLDTPTAGDAFICGYSVVDDPDKVRRLLGFMPDSFGKYGNMTVVEYLDFYARAYGLTGETRRDAVERVLVFTELRKIAEKNITTLSKGMSQRLGLGRTLIHDPQVLILDEPAAGLDPRARVELRELIRLLSTQLRKTVLISSHILTELGEICDSAAIIEAGEILAAGTVEELQNAPRRERSGRVALTIRTLGEAAPLERWLIQQPYVVAVEANGSAVAVEFEGDEKARCALLSSLVGEGFSVLEFGGKVESLEDAFMAITKGIVQ
ncbi:MAG: ABC transporter ATP-binding protein [Planctomycetota bacterium]|nr:ABC transporter ATP-binding protein [Planctomycetaceae bacterium]MDQ3329285.1 ABC transporter ATP-binding protein [Planctomycetota bacterium]